MVDEESPRADDPAGPCAAEARRSCGAVAPRRARRWRRARRPRRLPRRLGTRREGGDPLPRLGRPPPHAATCAPHRKAHGAGRACLPLGHARLRRGDGLGPPPLPCRLLRGSRGRRRCRHRLVLWGGGREAWGGGRRRFRPDAARRDPVWRLPFRQCAAQISRRSAGAYPGRGAAGGGGQSADRPAGGD